MVRWNSTEHGRRSVVALQTAQIGDPGYEQALLSDDVNIAPSNLRKGLTLIRPFLGIAAGGGTTVVPSAMLF